MLNFKLYVLIGKFMQPWLIRSAPRSNNSRVWGNRLNETAALDSDVPIALQVLCKFAGLDELPSAIDCGAAFAIDRQSNESPAALCILAGKFLSLATFFAQKSFPENSLAETIDEFG